jgi:hypothetical protein
MDDKEKAVHKLKEGVVNLIEQASEDGLSLPEISHELSFLSVHMCLFSTDGHALGVGPALDGAIRAIKANLEESQPEEDEEEEKCNGSKES